MRLKFVMMKGGFECRHFSQQSCNLQCHAKNKSQNEVRASWEEVDHL